MKKILIITLAFLAILVTGVLVTAGLGGLLGALGILDAEGAFMFGWVVGKVVWLVGIIGVAAMVVNFYKD